MLRRLQLKDIGPAKVLDFELAPRVNLMTGDNGLGKTFVLELAWWGLTQNWAGPPARPDPEKATAPEVRIQTDSGGVVQKFNFASQAWDYETSWHSYPGIVIYACVHGGFTILDPAKPLVPRSGSGSRATLHLESSEVFDGLWWNSQSICNGLIRDVVTWQDRQSELLEALEKALARLSPHSEETLRLGPPLRVSATETREIPTLSLPYGLVPVDLAPAGMRRILALAYMLVWTWSEHRAAASIRRQPETRNLVLLIDEIESHLHPQWQRVILPALMAVVHDLAPEIQLQILLTTHSPLVLASAEPFFDDDLDALFHFDLHQGEVQLAKEIWRPRGDVSAWLTSDIFDLGQARSVEAEVAIEKALAAFRRPNMPLEELRAIHRELNAVLKDTDPFWRRWVARAEKAGIDP